MSTVAPHPLSRFSSATVDEAQGRVGALPAAIRPLDPGMRLCGPAFCVRTTPGNNLLLHKAIYAAPKGSVLVVDVGGVAGHEYGYWGDIMTVAAQEHGLAGLVIDGGVRDADEIQASGFPVFCRMLAIRGTLKSADGEVGGAVSIERVYVRTGDIIVGDRDGVCVVPAHTVDTVAQQAQARVAKEDGIIAQLRQGKTTLELFGFH
jgi:4-hydroxy-4-methyl-2-oxoglutarate aldolase